MVVTDNDWIISFLSGKRGDYKDRSFNDILNFNDETLERCHDQIQWLFPLHEGSFYAQTYPLLTPDIVDEACQNHIIKENMRQASLRMSCFYGFCSVSCGDREKQRPWCKEFDHNLLRITRIIRSLRFFGLDQEAKDFYDSAMDSANFFCLSDLTKSYWWRAFNENIWKTLR